MGLARSTYYDENKGQPIEEVRLITRITEICAEFPRYGYRRVTAQLREDGIVVNHKKVLRLMKEHGLTVQPQRRYVVTTDGDHDGPIFPNLAKNVTPTGPNQLWVADITYPRCLVASCRWLCDRSAHRCAPDAGSAASRYSFACSAAWMHSSL